MDVEIHHTIESVPREEWDRVVEESPHGSVFHRYHWLAAVERGCERTGRYVVVSDGDAPTGVLAAAVDDVPLTPFERLCSPEPGFGGPVVADDEEETLDALLDAAERICEDGVVAHVFRTLDEETVRYQRRLRERGYSQTVASCRFVVDVTDGWDAVYGRMSSSRRRAIRSGHKNDVHVRDEVPDRSDLRAFHRGYRRVMDRVDGDAYPRSFFERLRTMDDRVRQFSLEVDGEPAGSILVLVDDEQSTVQYFFSAVEREHFEYNASELLHEHAIRWSIDNDYRQYDFGETSPDFRDGLFRFKERFGGRAVPTLSWERGCAPVRWNAFRLGRHLYQTANRLREERT
ncbi:GNAT family N-acetyltransferase [Haloprofundus sp. MHR1]|uniref:lipid II:glycine glycyltransferase FemX n=1 Tax=Haloprofundus sp. MHR1 TaxID=2572921 RepID=UPI0010BE4E0E|nr:GNAT family N-acetyltransferase [Haloprofundus sp. MHR1]QCJ47406.1 GNAT family N-acetyltransferase [Haloprofundus sp. MHR1]